MAARIEKTKKRKEARQILEKRIHPGLPRRKIGRLIIVGLSTRLETSLDRDCVRGWHGFAKKQGPEAPHCYSPNEEDFDQ